MKAKNLQILSKNNFRVPKFWVVKSADDINPTFSFLLDDKIKYAVRSSFEMEDGKTSSFAGQFTTLLNVEKRDIREAVQKVLDSANAKNVSEYKNVENSSTDAACRVIIQEMVDAEVSGVMFSANPMGILNETVITVGYGLGNNVVEDKADTTTYFYNQDDKSYCVEASDNSPQLDDTMIKKLIATLKEIKNVFKYEVDVEFVIKNNHVFILQARPITTLNTNTFPIILDNSNIVESYPGISSPLTQDFVHEIYHHIFYNLVLRLGGSQLASSINDKLSDMVDVCNGRIYYRISNWYHVLKILPFSNKIIPIWQEMLGVENKYVQNLDKTKVSFGKKLKITKNILHYMRKIPTMMDELDKKFQSNVTAYWKDVEYADTIPELLLLYAAIKDDILKDWDLTLINDLYAFLNTYLAGKKNKDQLADIKNLASMEPVKALDRLLIIAHDKGVESKEYQEAEKEYINSYGDRCYGELKLETPTYRTNPELLRQQVITASINPKPMLQDTEEHHLTNRYAKKARMGIKNREISRLHRSRIFGITREIFLKIGEILVKNNQIDDIRDVFYLRMEELKRSDDMRALVEERKHQEECYKSVPAISRWVFLNKVSDTTSHLMNSVRNTKTNELKGIASSSGIARGEVILIDEPKYDIDTTDKIIVAKSTDPGWVFWIRNAAGIVAEKGSMLSHTAIISRELHKPAVVNVKDCTSILQTGDLVEVDANNGIVRIIQKGKESC